VARAVKGLGELALRVNDLDRMQAFYANVIGLEVMRQFPDVVFFRIAQGHGGHTTILALFDRGVEVGQEHTTLDHLAFSIDVADYATEQRRLEDLGVDVEPKVFDWTGWRSLFVRDPEGNVVELVCRDPALVPTWEPLASQ
jgi:catechol-2,3-dioxygenase